MKYSLFFVFLSFCCLSNAFSCEKNEESGILAIPLNDKCVDSVQDRKVYLKFIFVYEFEGKYYVDTETFGTIQVNNIKEDEDGYYLPIMIYMAPKPKVNVIPDPFVRFCSYGPEVEQHVDSATSSLLTAAGSAIGVAALATAASPVAGCVAAASLGYHIYKASKEIDKAVSAYNSSQDTDSSHNNNDQSSKMQESDSYDSASH